MRDPRTASVATGSVADMSDPNFIDSIGLVALSPDMRPFWASVKRDAPMMQEDMRVPQTAKRKIARKLRKKSF